MTTTQAARTVAQVAENPYRSQVLSWYRKCLKAAFTVPWETDQDALYVLEETRRLFHQNSGLTDIQHIERKVREVEMRYGLALHYTIPYPRPFHKVQGAMQESAVPYAAYLDSFYDHAVNPHTGYIHEGSYNGGTMGGSTSSSYYYADNMGTSDVDGRENDFDTDDVTQPPNRTAKP